MGPRAFEEGGRPGRKRCARLRLRICPAVARRRGGARLFLHHRSRATGRQCAGDIELLRRSSQSSPTCARSRVSRATSTSRRSRRAPPPRRMRSTSRRLRGRRPSARSKSSPATIPPAGSRRAAPFPANRGAVPAGLPSQMLERRPDVHRGRTPFRRRVSSRGRSEAPRACRVLRISGRGRAGNGGT